MIEAREKGIQIGLKKGKGGGRDKESSILGICGGKIFRCWKGIILKVRPKKKPGGGQGVFGPPVGTVLQRPEPGAAETRGN